MSTSSTSTSGWSSAAATEDHVKHLEVGGGGGGGGDTSHVLLLMSLECGTDRFLLSNCCGAGGEYGVYGWYRV